MRKVTVALAVGVLVLCAVGCAGGSARRADSGPSTDGSAAAGAGSLALVGFHPSDLVTGVIVVDLSSGSSERVGGGQEAWSPAWLGDGHRLAMIRRATPDAVGQLVTVRTGLRDGVEGDDVSGDGAVVAATAQALDARSTPDGRRLVWIGRSAAASPFCDAPPPSEPLGLYVADVDGTGTLDGTGLTGVRRVADLAPTANLTVPSPDGRTVAVVDLGETTGPCDGGNARLALLDVETGAQRFVSGLTERIGVPHWSPDGRTLALDGDDFATGQTRDLVLVDVPSATARRLVTPGTVESSPVFSPDGQCLAFLRHDDGARALASASVVLADADSGHPRVLALTGTDDEDLVWSRDGSQLVVAGARIEPMCDEDGGSSGDGGGCDVAGADPGVRTVDVATGELRPLSVTAALLQSQLTTAP